MQIYLNNNMHICLLTDNKRFFFLKKKKVLVAAHNSDEIFVISWLQGLNDETNHQVSHVSQI